MIIFFFKYLYVLSYLDYNHMFLHYFQKYTLAVTDFLAMGKDGYDLFDECPAVVGYILDVSDILY